MPPKRAQRPGFLPVNPEVLLTIEERRERIRLRRAAAEGPYPAVPARSDSSRAAPPLANGNLSSTPGRHDFAEVRNVVRGGRQSALADSSSMVEGMVALLRRDRESASGRGARASLLNTWRGFHLNAREVSGCALGEDIIPVTALGLEIVAAYFKRGGYRSFPNYLSAIKSVHVEAGHSWTEQLEGMGRWTTRSVLRGIGPARQSRPFKLNDVLGLPLDFEPLVTNGPRFPIHAVLIGSMFLLREVELAGILLENVTLEERLQEVTIRLTSSKSDSMALGTSRTWGCVCGVATLPCPFHLCKVICAKVVDDARGLGLSGAALSGIHLFGTSDGTVPLKAQFVETFEAVALKLNLQILTAEGTRAYGGHTLRVTGAQTLAAHGIEISKIRILARHSGEAILRYVAEAPLTTLRADLGLPPAQHPPALGVTTRAPPRQENLLLASAIKRLDSHAEQLRSLQTLVVQSRSILFVENLATNSIHGMRQGDAQHTSCGWNVGPARQRLGGIRWRTDLLGCAWRSICERCLLPERQAARIALNSLQLDSSESE
jgi:hypothetical protein